MITGYILVKYNLIEQLRNLKVIGWTTLLFGILLICCFLRLRQTDILHFFLNKKLLLILNRALIWL